ASCNRRAPRLAASCWADTAGANARQTTTKTVGRSMRDSIAHRGQARARGRPSHLPAISRGDRACAALTRTRSSRCRVERSLPCVYDAPPLGLSTDRHLVLMSSADPIVRSPTFGFRDDTATSRDRPMKLIDKILTFWY